MPSRRQPCSVAESHDDGGYDNPGKIKASWPGNVDRPPCAPEVALICLAASSQGNSFPQGDGVGESVPRLVYCAGGQAGGLVPRMAGRKTSGRGAASIIATFYC